MTFTAEELDTLRQRGIALGEAERQLALLRNPPPARPLVRPCTLGDGIERLTKAQRDVALTLADLAARDGRCERFVPASGAATRMFKELLGAQRRPELLSPPGRADAVKRGDAEALTLDETLASLTRFAFHAALTATLAQRGQDLKQLLALGTCGPVLDALLGPDGLDYAALPKGLLLFHRASEGARTAFEEQLHEAAAIGRDAHGRVSAHFTVSPEHAAGFASRLAAVRASIEHHHAVTLDVRFSQQHRATDTLAVNEHGEPVRERDHSGALLFRPSGHGALIENLAALGGDLVLIKNIDNVQPDRLRPPTIEAARLLIGRLIEVQHAVHALLRRLDDAATPEVIADGERLWSELSGELPSAADASPAAGLRERLHRPIRVCGMVQNTGEPGGGPFWVRDRDGRETRQIVESAEVDMHADEQRAVFASGTHFNPVFLACGLRDHRGEAHALERFVDPDAAIVTRKSAHGHELRALERPGLWNGAMARWLTLFVEVPLTVFTPVKHVNDLLRAEHQP